MTVLPQQWHAAHSSAVFTDRSDLGMLKIRGETRLDLIHRMSTQAVSQLKSGEGAATVLTNEIGRIIDRLILYASSDTVYALTGENNADNIARYLMRFVFFNDDFHLEDVSAETAVFGVYGPRARAKLVEAGFPDVDLPLHHWRQVTLGDHTFYLHKTDPIAGDGYFVMSQMVGKAALVERFRGAGLVEIDAETFEALRVEAGVPRFGAELSLDYIPLETGLWEDVSFTKGCYIGQEIIARMESRGKLAKKLVRLRSDEALSPGDAIRANEKQVGTVTSAAATPQGYVALAYVKTAVLEKESALTVGETAVYPQRLTDVQP